MSLYVFSKKKNCVPECDAHFVKGAFEDAHKRRPWHAAEVLVLTYGDSMLFLKCVTDKGGSERTETSEFSITLFGLRRVADG